MKENTPHPTEILRRLIQFDTTNPPGNEAACVAYIQGLLREAGIEANTYEKVAGRPNLIARIPGRGDAAPLLLQGHVDVVTTQNQQWSVPPFAALEQDGFIWGRGALDMKGGVAMMSAAFLRMAAGNTPPPGDVILCILSDEETGGEAGAKYLVEEHPDLFEGVRYALGEFGGFTLYIGGKRFYPIMVAEKQICWLRATARGAAGHGSMPIRGGAMARIARMLTTLDQNSLPIHIDPVTRMSIEALAQGVGGATGLILRQLLNPALADFVLRALGERGRVFGPMLRNTVSPTILHASQKINVIPGEVSVELDGRLLPGFTPDDVIRELRILVDKDIELDVMNYEPYPSSTNLGLFEILKNTLQTQDPQGIPIPLLLVGVTDGRHFARLGIQTYGFLPMQLPEDFNFSSTIHAANERIPADALEFGTQAIYTVLERFS